MSAFLLLLLFFVVIIIYLYYNGTISGKTLIIIILLVIVVLIVIPVLIGVSFVRFISSLCLDQQCNYIKLPINMNNMGNYDNQYFVYQINKSH